MPSKGLPLLATAVVLVTAGCGTGHHSGAPAGSAPASSAPAATTTTAVTTTTVPATTTTTLPPSPQATPLAAATIFIDGWKSGDRARAATVATAGAVSTLFAHAYAGQTVINRQCTVEFVPRVCAFGPYGGGSGALYQVYLQPAGPNWYVSSVQVLG